jgi:hypothetical protein
MEAINLHPLFYYIFILVLWVSVPCVTICPKAKADKILARLLKAFA